MTAIRLALATVIAAAVGFAIHVIYGEGILQTYIQQAADAGRLDSVDSGVPPHIAAIAFITVLIPYSAKTAIYYWAGHLIPGQAPLVKGIIYGLVLLCLDHQLLRMPIMNTVVGNPIDIALLMSAESWAIELLSGVIIAHLVPLRASPKPEYST
ncbi:MAG: hypothetical protein AAGA23_17525 [Pseudomonadota bacterium]